MLIQAQDKTLYNLSVIGIVKIEFSQVDEKYHVLANIDGLVKPAVLAKCDTQEEAEKDLKDILSNAGGINLGDRVRTYYRERGTPIIG